MNDHKGAGMLLPALPPAKELLADRGYDSNHFRNALIERGIVPCIPSSRRCNVEIPYDALLHRQCHRIENAFARLKDWRRVAMRYDRCAHSFFSAICTAPGSVRGGGGDFGFGRGAGLGWRSALAAGVALRISHP